MSSTCTLSTAQTAGAACTGPFAVLPFEPLGAVCAAHIRQGCNAALGCLIREQHVAVGYRVLECGRCLIWEQKRYALMAQDMDVDAGDQSLSAAQRAQRLFDLTLAVASGQVR